MPDLIPFAVTHIGVSVALAAMLILMHPRLHRADFLLYLGDVPACIAGKPGGQPRGPPFASDVLTGRGYRKVEASNGVEALNLAADVSMDIPVRDGCRPRISGPELAGRLEELRPGLRILFVSGYSFDQEFGTTPVYLQKPYTPEQLCQVASPAETYR